MICLTASAGELALAFVVFFAVGYWLGRRVRCSTAILQEKKGE